MTRASTIACGVLLATACTSTGLPDGGTSEVDAWPALPDVGPCAETDAGPRLDAGAPPALDCCTDALCAAIGEVCDETSCRCARVPCTEIGAPCDASLVPIAHGGFSCVESPAGPSCHVVVSHVEDCPAGIPWCVGTPADGTCACGLGCRAFFDDCPAGVACTLFAGGPYGSGAVGDCRGSRPGTFGEGARCSPGDCAAGLVCGGDDPTGPVCTRVDCGLAEGAPACTGGRICRAIDRLGLVGTCELPCDPWDLDAPCADTEVCVPRDRNGSSLGTCRHVSELPLPRLGEACASQCATGLVCVYGSCAEHCDPDERNPDPLAACAAPQRCVAGDGYGGSVCAAPCDPRSTRESCDAQHFCRASSEHCTLVGACLPRTSGLGGRGELCGIACDSGLVCTGGATWRCAPACAVDADCVPGERCFAQSATPGVGFCARPCEPGGTDCPVGAWCEPRELDRAASRWIGACVR